MVREGASRCLGKKTTTNKTTLRQTSPSMTPSDEMEVLSPSLSPGSLPAAAAGTLARLGWREFRWRKRTAEDPQPPTSAVPRTERRAPSPSAGSALPARAGFLKGSRSRRRKREAASPNARVWSWVLSPGCNACRRHRQQPLLPATRTNQSPLRGTGK